MSKKIILTTLIFMTTLGVQLSSAQQSAQAQVEKAVSKLIQAMLTANRNDLADLVSDKLSYGHSSGKIENKKEFVETIASGGSVFEEIKIEDQHIDIENGTAIVRHTLIAKTNDPGKGPGSIKLGIVVVWTQSDTGWKMLARQAFKLP